MLSPLCEFLEGGGKESGTSVLPNREFTASWASSGLISLLKFVWGAFSAGGRGNLGQKGLEIS